MCIGDFPHIESTQCKETFCKTAVWCEWERVPKKEEGKRERKKELCLIPPYLITGN